MVCEILNNCGIIPVVAIDDASDSYNTANALLKGDISVMEITFRTDEALKAIENVVENIPEMIVGAGTVLNLQQAKQAISAGARFMVSPGFDDEIVEYCIERNIPIIPGCVTPSEITRALKYGISVIKFFPASLYGGLSGINALSAPFQDVQFVPTGGINIDNLESYILSPKIFAVGGTWICKKKDIAEKKFDLITSLSLEATSLIKQIRNRK